MKWFLPASRAQCGGFGPANGVDETLALMGRGVLVIILWLGLTTITGGADSPRPQTRDFRPVDFSSLATPSEALARQFAALPGGEQLFHGVPFRIGSPLAVTGLESARGGAFFPTEVAGLKPGDNVKRIHLLHGTLFAEKDGVPVAKIVFHYASGGEETVRLGYGVHVRGWIAPRLEKRSTLFDPNSCKCESRLVLRSTEVKP